MLQYRTNAGERRKPALGMYGELTVEQARSLAQNWLAEVRRGGDPGAAKTEARKAPTVAELCKKFMEDYSKKRNKPSTQLGYQGVIDRCIIPLLGRKKVHDVKRPDVAGLMEKLSYKQTEANKAFSILRKMFNLAEVWGYRPDGTNPCRHVPMFSAPTSSSISLWLAKPIISRSRSAFDEPRRAKRGGGARGPARVRQPDFSRDAGSASVVAMTRCVVACRGGRRASGAKGINVARPRSIRTRTCVSFPEGRDTSRALLQKRLQVHHLVGHRWFLVFRLVVETPT